VIARDGGGLLNGGTVGNEVTVGGKERERRRIRSGMI